MPKIVLKNGETGENEEFEPVDAREILSQEGTIYTVAPEGKEVGTPTDVSVPQYQGDDAEMQVGLSIDKYGRSNVVKATPGAVVHSAPMATTTEGKQSFADARSGESKTARAKRSAAASE